MDYLRQVLAEPDTVSLRLDRAALELARIQEPELEVQPVMDRLNELASQLGDRLRNFNDGRDFVETAQRFLFDELGFHGNDEDYYDPLNSCLNQVLERRKGIPVTLSVLYMEIARRLQMPVFGIGLPRHFVIEFDDGNYATYIDPYHGGRTVTARECFMLAGSRVADPALLQRVSKRDIVRRMIQNLHRGYMRRGDWTRAVATLDLLLEGGHVGVPGIAGMHKLRGMLLAELRRYQDARADLERYLALEPDPPDKEEVKRQLAAIHQWLARLN